MFCPNCGTKNSVGLNYCRSCGLKLERIVEAVADQLPSEVDAETQRRTENLERSGFRSVLLAGVSGLILFVVLATQYTNLGYYFTAVLIGSIVAWLVFFALPAAGSLSYAKAYLKRKKIPLEKDQPTGVATGKLIEDRPFEPAPPSITEDTTELLNIPRASHKE
jgi:hypothetical protein